MAVIAVGDMLQDDLLVDDGAAGRMADRNPLFALMSFSLRIGSFGDEVETPARTGVPRFASLGHLYAALDGTYRLGISLPDAPLASFRAAAKELARTTEAERLVIQRVGQDVLRQALLAYWGGRCPLTGITDPALLRASHIVPWSECVTDEHRLDVTV
jgi:hypothetical protein